MDAADIIRQAVAQVGVLRAQTQATPDLHRATMAVKGFQSRRFAAGYADLLASPDFGAAARFFLQELYSERDYSERDRQFARIAGAIETFFPRQVVATAVAMARLHQQTEELDHRMALVWLQDKASRDDASRYVTAWRSVGEHAARDFQVQTVLMVGYELDRLTRKPGLRMLLRLMRKPANAAGLGSLQNFLENGFDTFAAMAARGALAQQFLDTIRSREAQWSTHLFDQEQDACCAYLRQLLQPSRC